MRIFGAAIGLAASALLLSACGGGSDGRDRDDGGDDGEPAPLSGKSDVLRELSIVANVAQLFGYGDGLAEPSSALFKAAGVPSGHWGRYSARNPSLLKAATRHDCDSGSYTLEEGSGQEPFGYFDGTRRAVSFRIYNYDDCTIDDESGNGSSYDDGRVENGSGTPNASNETYDYSLLGSGDTPHLYRRYEPVGSRTELTEFYTLGRFEFKSTTSQQEQRSILSFRLNAEDDDYLLDLDLGNGSGPFAIAENTSSQTLSLSGPYRYHSSICDWTYAQASTPTPLAIASDGFTAGRLRIESDRGLATITFAADGSARYELSNGNSGTLNASEIGLAVSEPAC